LTDVVIVTIGNGVIVHSVLLTCDAALFAEFFPMFLRNVGKHWTQWLRVRSKNNGILNHTALKTSRHIIIV